MSYTVFSKFRIECSEEILSEYERLFFNLSGYPENIELEDFFKGLGKNLEEYGWQETTIRKVEINKNENILQFEMLSSWNIDYKKFSELFEHKGSKCYFWYCSQDNVDDDFGTNDIESKYFCKFCTIFDGEENFVWDVDEVRDLVLNYGYSFDEDEENRFVEFINEVFDADTSKRLFSESKDFETDNGTLDIELVKARIYE